MRVVQMATPLLVVLLLANPLAAAEEKSGRYSMTPAEGGALKLDTVTGAVSFCTRADGDWSCKPTKDGEQILRREIDGLKSEVDVLKDQLTKMEEIAGIGDPAKTDRPRAPGQTSNLPSDKDVDAAFDYFERMVKKLRERLNRLEGETKPGTPL
jgi:hypothetical protein